MPGHGWLWEGNGPRMAMPGHGWWREGNGPRMAMPGHGWWREGNGPRMAMPGHGWWREGNGPRMAMPGHGWKREGNGPRMAMPGHGGLNVHDLKALTWRDFFPKLAANPKGALSASMKQMPDDRFPRCDRGPLHCEPQINHPADGNLTLHEVNASFHSSAIFNKHPWSGIAIRGSQNQRKSVVRHSHPWFSKPKKIRGSA
jgi:hypothetical protein